MDLYRLARGALFRLDAERAHDVTLAGLAVASRSHLARQALARSYAAGTRDPRLQVRAFGLTFPNPVGLAAGLDKNGVAVPALAALGFGSIEVGTVTAVPQPGNDRPRLFRLVEDDALINRMGFNNEGAARLAERLARVRATSERLPPIGVNVGKSRSVDAVAAPGDYRASLEATWDVADYLVVNVSSPNTPGLRDLQATSPLRAVLAEAGAVAEERGPKPVLVKLSPDLDAEALVEAALVADGEGAAGIIATNTTSSRTGLKGTHASEAGGLSGRPLAPLALEALNVLVDATRLDVVSAGGVFDAEDVAGRLSAGARLVQVYTSFVFRGPALPGDLCRGLIARSD